MAQRRRAPAGEAIDPALEEEYDSEAEAAEQAAEQQRLQRMLGDLALLNGTTHDDVDWYIYRVRSKPELSANPEGGPRELVAHRHGALDLMQLAGEFGGGTFDFYPVFDSGDGTGKRLQTRQRHTLAGPRKDFSAAPPAVPPPAVATAAIPGQPSIPSSMDRLIRLLVKQQMQADARFERLLQAVATSRSAVPAPPAPALGDLVNALKGMDELRGQQLRGQQPREQTPIEVAKMVMDGFRQGVEIGQVREPLPPNETSDPNYMPVVEKGLEILQTILSRPPRRPGGPPPGAQPPPGRSEATVLETPGSTAASAAASTAPPTNEHRWRTAIESLYRAMIAGDSPQDFAAGLDMILNGEEITELEHATTDQVIGVLGHEFKRFPSPMTEDGEVSTACRVYLTEVLTALRQPDIPEGDSAE